MTQMSMEVNHAAEAIEDSAETSPVECSIATVEESADWDRYVTAADAATGYHLWRWQYVFDRALGHRCHYLIARRGASMVGVLPLVEVRSRLFGRALSSLPYVNYGGVLASDQAAAVALLESAGDLARRRALSYVLMRHSRRVFSDVPARSHKVTLLLQLAATSQVMWDRLDRKVRNQVRKAEKSGVTIECGGAELLNDFYGIFARNMRDLGTPVYGRNLFAAILEQFPVEARLHVARLKGRAIAGALSYAYRNRIEVPSASSLREFRALCPNHLLYWSIICYALAQGHGVFDFGRSTPDDGTYHFKRQWGAEPLQLWWEYHLGDGARLPSADRHSSTFRASIEIWKRLPTAVATLIGPRLARLVP